MTISIENTLRRLVAELLKIDQSAVRPEDGIEDLGGDSLDAIDLLMNVEREFMIEFDDAAWEACSTFADYHKLLINTIGNL